MLFRSPDGEKEAIVIFNYEIGGEAKSDTLVLIGNTVQVFYATPNPYDAGVVIIGLTGQGSVVISNETEWDITLDTRQAKSDGIFVLTPPAITALLLKPDSSVAIGVDFIPLEEIEYTDTIIATIQVKGCPPSQNSILLRGNGKASANVVFSLPDTTVLPTIDGFRLPVYAQITNASQDESITVYNIEAEVRFNSTLFYPESISRGRILSNEIVAQDLRGVKFKIDTAEISSVKGILTELIGPTLLGSVKSTTLKFYKDTLSWETYGLASSYKMESGSITSIICEKGQDRLLTVKDKAAMNIFPNPAGDELDIEIRVLETGRHTLEIMKVKGRRRRREKGGEGRERGEGGGRGEGRGGEGRIERGKEKKAREKREGKREGESGGEGRGREEREEGGGKGGGGGGRGGGGEGGAGGAGGGRGSAIEVSSGLGGNTSSPWRGSVTGDDSDQ